MQGVWLAEAIPGPALRRRRSRRSPRPFLKRPRHHFEVRMMKAPPAAVKLWQKVNAKKMVNDPKLTSPLDSLWSTSTRTQPRGGRHHLDQRARHQRGRPEPDKIATASLAYTTASLNASELLCVGVSAIAVYTYDEVYTTALSRQVHRAQAAILKGRAAELPTPLSRPWTPTLEKSCENLQPQLATSPDFSFSPRNKLSVFLLLNGIKPTTTSRPRGCTPPQLPSLLRI